MRPLAIASTTTICSGFPEACSMSPAKTQIVASTEPKTEQSASFRSTWLFNACASLNFQYASAPNPNADGIETNKLQSAPFVSSSMCVGSKASHATSFTVAKQSSIAALATKVAPMPMELLRSRRRSRASLKRTAASASLCCRTFGFLKRHKTNAEDNASSKDSVPKPISANSASEIPMAKPTSAANNDATRDATDTSLAAALCLSSLLSGACDVSSSSCNWVLPTFCGAGLCSSRGSGAPCTSTRTPEALTGSIA
mmetsp:Transcript_68438/g.198461  ORF Transcript_68438/g.198461 Transcript_68438/m.198461 type:complete len:256 (+) Transcript_68438:206-973(+)